MVQPPALNLGKHEPPLVVELADNLCEGSRLKLESAFQALEAHLRAGFPPGVAAAVCGTAGVLGRAWGGWAKLPPRGIRVSPDTLFDLASLTKVMATTPLCLRLEHVAAWSLEDPVQRWVHGFQHPAITLRHCLTHTSGLPAHKPFWELADSPAGIRVALFDVEPDAPPGERVVYSDLNFMLLGWAVESCAGRPLDVLCREHVLSPLAMTGSGYRPPATHRSRIAASEVWGHVHDENARALGGVSGHAGLFAPLDDVAKFAQALIASDRHPGLAPYLPPDPSQPRIGAPPDVRGLGWRLQPQPIAPGWPEDAYGHTGFTGTSMLVAPRSGIAAVLLSNAVHPKRRLNGAASLRADFHRALLPLLKPPPSKPRS
ncbi:MAG: serine hydrolase domain-containing protein [Candidatus Dormibacteria bacterium]